MVEIYYL